MYFSLLINFLQWQSGGTSGKGCMNMICPGFQKTSKSIAPGHVITPLSHVHGKKSYIKLRVFKVRNLVHRDILRWTLFMQNHFKLSLYIRLVLKTICIQGIIRNYITCTNKLFNCWLGDKYDWKNPTSLKDVNMPCTLKSWEYQLYL
jgi:ferredoxin-fold anticodon binding domain-containing protein